MIVKDVIISALNLLGRPDLAGLLSSGAALNAEESETVNTLLYCFNSVEDELARKYIPLSSSDTVVSLTGEFEYTLFSHTPVRIKRVLSEGAEIEYEIYSRFLKADARRITVEYEYSPAKKALNDESDFGGEAGENLFAYGAAAEYCLINGETEAAEIWENKYRKEIDGTQSGMAYGGYIPPRRWV